MNKMLQTRYVVYRKQRVVYDLENLTILNNCPLLENKTEQPQLGKSAICIVPLKT